MGAADRAADARRHDPGLCQAIGAPQAAPTPPRLHLRAQRRDDGRLDATAARHRRSSSRAMLKPLAPFRDDMLVLSGLAHSERQRAWRWSRRPRARGRVVPDRRAPAEDGRRRHPERHLGRSDRRAASRGQTRFASLELGCDDSRTVGNCDSGYSCAYTNSLAWRGTDHADASRDESAAGVRAAVRRHRHERPAGSARAAAAAPPQHPRPGRRAHEAAAAAISGRRIAASSTNTCTPSARSSSASKSPRRTSRASRPASTSRPAFPCCSPTT